MTEPRHSTGQGRGALDLDRIAFFSDAVIAIAITLLAIELVPPQASEEELGHALLEMWPEFASFGLSFGSIAAYWAAHHRMLRRLSGWDDGLVAINLLFLLAVVLLPFSTNLLGRHLTHLLPVVIIIYTANLLAAEVALALLWWHVRHAHLLQPDVSNREVRRMHWRLLANIAILALAIPWTLLGIDSPWIPWVVGPLLSRTARAAH